MQIKNKKAFSLIELSIVILIVGIIVAGVTQSSRLISAYRLSSARNMTHSAPVTSMRDLAMWYEPTKEYAFATGSAGTYVDQSILDNTNQIARWNDLAPQNSTKIHSVQSTLALQPTYVTGAINNLPAVRFTAASTQYLVSAFDLNVATNPDVTFIIVFKRVGAGVDQTLFGNDNGSWDRFACPVHSVNSGNGGVPTGGAFNTVAGFNAFNTPMVFTLIAKNAVTNGSTTYINGTNVTTFTETHGTTGDTVMGIGAQSGASAFTFYDGYIAEFIVFSRGIKTEERQAIERYLGKKWGITVS